MCDCEKRDDTMPQSRLIDSYLSRTDIPLMPGQNLHDPSQDQSPETIAHYRVLKRLGKGGMGEVFLAEDTKQHGRRVALKILPPELTKDDSRVRRFRMESSAVLALTHPNIITILELG